MTVVLSSSSHGNPVFQTLTFQDRPGENWVGSPAMQAVEMVNQNQLMQLFDFFMSRRSENAWNVFLSTGVCHSRSFQIPVVENDICCIASQVLMSKVLGSLWLQFQGQFCGCMFFLSILCERPEAIDFCQELMVPISILLFGLQKFRPVTQFGSFSRQSTPRAASHQPHKAK